MNIRTVTYCPTCGSEVRVVGGDEGTQHYEPTVNSKYEALKAAMNEREAEYNRMKKELVKECQRSAQLRKDLGRVKP